MPEPELGASARRWLTPGPTSPWRFDDDGETLVWRDGETIAFRSEVEAALSRVARTLEVIPPFPAVAVLIATARAEGRRISTEHWDTIRSDMEAAAPGLLAGVAAAKEVAETASALRVIEQVPDEVFTRPDALALLVETVIDGAELGRDPTRAAEFLRDLEAAPTPGTDTRTDLDAPCRAGEWGQGLAALRRGLAQLDPALFARRARTGLGRDILPADIEWPDGVQVRALLASLRGDTDLNAVARLTSDVMAAVRLPRPGGTPEELPIGGYVDLASRGSPERLLVSELAHDGLTLAARIALREALYLRRESPPRAPLGTRCILIDAGIRLWGVGRVFATSVALALAASSERGVSVRAWRASGRRIECVDLGTRAGIDAHLEALQPEPNPTAALRPFLAACSALPSGVECCIVTHANALADPEMNEALRAAGRVVFVAAVQASGDLSVHAFTAAGSQVLSTGRMNLAAVLAESSREPRSQTPPALHDRLRNRLRDPLRADASLPSILRLEQLPLRMPPASHHCNYLEAPNYGLVARSADRRLLLWTDPSLGPIELADHTPQGSLRDFRVIGDVVHLLLVGGHPRASSWMRAGLSTPFVETSELPLLARTPSIGIVIGNAGEAVALIVDRRVHIVHAGDASRVAQVLDLPTGARHAGGRLFRRASTGSCWMLTHDGCEATFQQLTTDHRGEVALVFERTAHEGPWAILRRPYRLLSLANGQVTALGVSDHLAPPVASSSGRRLLFQSNSAPWVIADLDDGTVREAPRGSRLQPLLESVAESLAAPNLRRRATAVGCTDDGNLVIDGKALTLAPRGMLQFETTGRPWSRNARTFSSARVGLPGCHWHLFTALRSDGSKAQIDSRGLIHLVSADASVPQLTFVHRDGETAAWSSDGLMHGSRYYLGDTPSAPGVEFLRRVLRFTDRLR